MLPLLKLRPIGPLGRRVQPPQSLISVEQLEKEYLKVIEFDNEFLTLCQARADYLVRKQRKNPSENLTGRAYVAYIKEYVAKVQVEDYRSKYANQAKVFYNTSNITSSGTENNSSQVVDDENVIQWTILDPDTEGQKEKCHEKEELMKELSSLNKMKAMNSSITNQYVLRDVLFCNQLQTAALEGNTAELERLVSCGTDIQDENINALNILFIAVHEGHWNVFLFLMLYRGESLFGFMQQVDVNPR